MSIVAKKNVYSNEREFDEELYEREPMRGMGGIARGARRMFRGGSRGGSAPSSESTLSMFFSLRYGSLI